MNEIKIAVVGNIDSGKSTFIGRIVKAIKGMNEDVQLHYVTDSLTVERDNNKTISSSEHIIEYGDTKIIFLNCPGHIEYIEDTISRMLESDLIINVSENLDEYSYILEHVKKISKAKNNKYINVFNFRDDWFEYSDYENILKNNISTEYCLKTHINILEIDDIVVKKCIIEQIISIYNLNKITMFENRESYAITVSSDDSVFNQILEDKKGNKHLLIIDEINDKIKIRQGIFLKLLKIIPEPTEELIQIIKDNKNNITTIAIAMIDKNKHS